MTTAEDYEAAFTDAPLPEPPDDWQSDVQPPQMAATATDTAPKLIRLTELLAEPDEPVRYRVDRLLPTGGRVVFAAQYKSGKTVATDNLVRALADVTPFLDHFDVDPLPDGKTVVLIDNEMSRDQVRRWLRDQGIENPDRVHVVILRGKVSTFDLLDPTIRAGWVGKLRAVNAAVVVFDCLRPVLDALGLDEHRDAGRFLVAFDALLAEANISEAAVVHHMGHSGERSRGDSRIRDWPDVEWRLVRQAEPGEEPDPSAPRYFSAYGRDVEVPEGALTFDPATRHLTFTGGNRKDVKTQAALADVLDVLDAATEALSGRAIERALDAADHGRAVIRQALKQGIKESTIVTESGPRNATLHRLNRASAPVRRSAPSALNQSVSECASAPIGGALHSHSTETENTERASGALNSTDTDLFGEPSDICRTCGKHSAFGLVAGECRRCHFSEQEAAS